MGDIISAITKVIVGYETTGEPPVHVDGFVDWFGDVSNMLIANDLVKFIIALGIIGLLIGVVMKLISKIRGRKKRR
jgi:hypothetical protein